MWWDEGVVEEMVETEAFRNGREKGEGFFFEVEAVGDTSTDEDGALPVEFFFGLPMTGRQPEEVKKEKGDELHRLLVFGGGELCILPTTVTGGEVEDVFKA